MSALATAKGFSIGDVVFIGPAAPLDRKVTWKVVSLFQAVDTLAYAVVHSGLSGQYRTVPLERLTRYGDGHRLMEPA